MDYSVYQIFTAFFVGLLIGGTVLFIYQVFFRKHQEKLLEKESNRILNKAKSEAYRIEKMAELQTKDWKIKMQKEMKEEMQSKKNTLEKEYQKLQLKQSTTQEEIQHKLDDLRFQKKELEREALSVKQKDEHLERLKKDKEKQLDKLNAQLENISNITKEQAREELTKSLEEEVKLNLSSQLKQMEESLKKESKEKAKNILAIAIARHASTVTTEHTTDSLPVSEEIKGKIIGREGRNIRTLENACGVDVIIEEGQDFIILSCFDPVRRTVAKESMIRLIKDGRIHPSRIEDMVEKVRAELFQSIKEEGEKTCFNLNIHDVHPEIVKTLGGLKFKMIGGQNVLQLSVNLAILSGYMMAEIGGDEKQIKRAALLHGIGLNLDHRIEGNYAQVGAEFARKHREKPEIVQAILCHNSHTQAKSMLDHILQTSFNLYQSYPGSKRSNLETFIQRMKDVESIANSFSGVIRSFAIRSGKELRVLVDSSQVTDDQTDMLCRDIANKIERELKHSYQLRVNVIRESRIIEHAR